MTEHIIVDSHCHLDFPDFEGEIPDLVARANDAGVKRMVTICTKLKNEPSVRKIAEEHEAVYYAAGTHPMSAASEPLASVDQLIEISQHPKMVGIGETGLDYHYTAESAVTQKTSLKIHIDAVVYQAHDHPVPNTAVTVHGADRVGIVAEITERLYQAGFNITHLESSLFFLFKNFIFILKIVF